MSETMNVEPGAAGPGLRPWRDAGLTKAISKAGGVRQLARRIGVAHPSVLGWLKVPRDRVAAVAAATGMRAAEIRPDLSDLFEAEADDHWWNRARARFGLSAQRARTAAEAHADAAADKAATEVLDLGVTLGALRFAAQAHGLGLRALLAEPAGGQGGAPTPAQTARSLGMALAVIAGRVPADRVAEVAGVTRQAVDNACARYLRKRDGDDPETVVDGHVIERGRPRLAKGADPEVWDCERRFLRLLSGGAA